MLFAPVPLTVVGIFATPTTTGDPYWDAQAFGEGASQIGGNKFLVAPFLTTADALLKAIAHFQALLLTPNGGAASFLSTPLKIESSWHAYLDPAAMPITRLDDAIARIDNLTATISDSTNVQDPLQSDTTISGDTIGNASTLVVFRSRNAVSQSALTLFLIEIVGIVCLFVGVLMEMLIGRQANFIAVMRSRGASRSDIFRAFSLQSLTIGTIALIIGPLLAVPLVIILARRTLPASSWPVLQPLQKQPIPTAESIGIYALVVVIMAVFIMISAIWPVARSDILTLRRETARATRVPYWQRAHLDVLLIIAAVGVFGLALYVNDSGILNTTTSIQLAPLSVVAPLCLLLAVTLLFLRFLALLLRGLQALVARSRGAAAPIALAIVARAPRQILRMTLLLALATALIIFTQVFIASQQQRITDVAAYQAEADFSGTMAGALPFMNPTPPPYKIVQEWTQAYQAIPGVQSATVGYANIINDGTSGQQVEVEAVDAATFAQTAIWPRNNGPLALATMMQTLAEQRDVAIGTKVLPAFVDTSLWNALHLHTGYYFNLLVLSDPNQGGYRFQALGEIPHLPPVTDSIDVPNTTTYANNYVTGGVLVDYLTAHTLAAKTGVQSEMGPPIVLNTVWLKTQSAAPLLKTIRATLSKGNLQLINLRDRRATIDALLHDPPYLAIVQVLQLGAIVAFILTVMGGLLSSWFNVHDRLTSFALLRALGANPSQIARIFLWEQGITYVTALVLGVALGLVLSLTVIPSLVFTSGAAVTGGAILSEGEFYAIQRTPAVQVVVPSSLAWGLATYFLVWVVAIGLMMRLAARPSISQALRLNED